MTELTFTVERCDDSGWLVASWDELGDNGGITTQGQDLRELQEMIHDAVRCHFGGEKLPPRIRLHFVNDPILLSKPFVARAKPGRKSHDKSVYEAKTTAKAQREMVARAKAKVDRLARVAREAVGQS